MSKPRDIPPAVIERQTRGVGPGQLGLGGGQRRLGQDPRAGAARDPAAAIGRRSGAHPLHHLHQGRRRQYGEPRLQRSAVVDSAGRRCARRCHARRPARSASMPSGVQRARQLFALALETPGGLKVHTIHAFCTQLLHLFPFEANVAARFEVLDETKENQLLEKLSLDVMLKAAGEPDSPLGRALAQAVLAAADMTFRDLVREVDPSARQADALGRGRRRRAAGDGAAFARARRRSRTRRSRRSKGAIFDESLIASSEWAAVGTRCRGGIEDRQGPGRPVPRAGYAERHRAARHLFRHLLHRSTRQGPKTESVTKAIQDDHPALCQQLDQRARPRHGLLLRASARSRRATAASRCSPSRTR